uniref:Uncharacterized protein n=1 Tax=Trypanosoma vivax (strain Y486) TaxID=1055687 RepID=G0U4N8_TRYVY|nr:hypothetical protein TVY486_1014450 [Trypanosoma vivax Y486]
MQNGVISPIYALQLRCSAIDCHILHSSPTLFAAYLVANFSISRPPVAFSQTKHVRGFIVRTAFSAKHFKNISSTFFSSSHLNVAILLFSFPSFSQSARGSLVP